MRALLEEHLGDLLEVAVMRAAAADENESPAVRAKCAGDAEGILADLAAAMAVEIGARELALA